MLFLILVIAAVIFVALYFATDKPKVERCSYALFIICAIAAVAVLVQGGVTMPVMPRS